MQHCSAYAQECYVVKMLMGKLRFDMVATHNSSLMHLPVVHSASMQTDGHDMCICVMDAYADMMNLGFWRECNSCTRKSQKECGCQAQSLRERIVLTAPPLHI